MNIFEMEFEKETFETVFCKATLDIYFTDP